MEFAKKIRDEILTCPICLQQLRKPKQLQCLHNFCRRCLVRYVKKTLWRNGRNCVCPVCREKVIPGPKYKSREDSVIKWVDSLTDNFNMTNLKQIIDNEVGQDSNDESNDTNSENESVDGNIDDDDVEYFSWTLDDGNPSSIDYSSSEDEMDLSLFDEIPSSASILSMLRRLRDPLIVPSHESPTIETPPPPSIIISPQPSPITTSEPPAFVTSPENTERDRNIGQTSATTNPGMLMGHVENLRLRIPSEYLRSGTHDIHSISMSRSAGHTVNNSNDLMTQPVHESPAPTSRGQVITCQGCTTSQPPGLTGVLPGQRHIDTIETPLFRGQAENRPVYQRWQNEAEHINPSTHNSNINSHETPRNGYEMNFRPTFGGYMVNGQPFTDGSQDSIFNHGPGHCCQSVCSEPGAQQCMRSMPVLQSPPYTNSRPVLPFVGNAAIPKPPANMTSLYFPPPPSCMDRVQVLNSAPYMCSPPKQQCVWQTAQTETRPPPSVDSLPGLWPLSGVTGPQHGPPSCMFPVPMPPPHPWYVVSPNPSSRDSHFIPPGVFVPRPQIPFQNGSTADPRVFRLHPSISNHMASPPNCNMFPPVQQLTGDCPPRFGSP